MKYKNVSKDTVKVQVTRMVYVEIEPGKTGEIDNSVYLSSGTRVKLEEFDGKATKKKEAPVKVVEETPAKVEAPVKVVEEAPVKVVEETPAVEEVKKTRKSRK